MDKKVIKNLISKALEMRAFSYVPYSSYAVGAALLTESGKVYTGCNIENSAYTPTVCAERTAFFKAVSEGEKKFTAIAICGGPEGKNPVSFAPPCGVCRQVMREFCSPEEFSVILSTSEDNYKIFTLKELLPEGFGPEFLN